MVNVIQNAGVSHAIVKSMMDATIEHLTWRPYLTFCPKGCVRTIAIVLCVRNTFCCPQTRQSPLTPCRPSSTLFTAGQAELYRAMGCSCLSCCRKRCNAVVILTYFSREMEDEMRQHQCIVLLRRCG